MTRIDARTTLIINADDFGLTTGVNRAIAELYAAGALTSATLMPKGPAFEDAVEQARAHPGLAIGCHIVLVDGLPVMPGAAIPSLVTRQGVLRDSLVHFALLLQARRIQEQQIEIEAIAQIRRLQDAGLRVTHVDTHKHTHLFPQVLKPLLRAAVTCGVMAIRNPFEPAWSARLTRGAMLRRLEVTLFRSLQSEFYRLLAEHGVATTDGCLGVSATGNLNAANLRTLLETAHAGTFELVCHPGYHDAALDAMPTRLRATREIERAALLDQIPAVAGSGDIRLSTMLDLKPTPRNEAARDH